MLSERFWILAYILTSLILPMAALPCIMWRTCPWLVLAAGVGAVFNWVTRSHRSQPKIDAAIAVFGAVMLVATILRWGEYH